MPRIAPRCATRRNLGDGGRVVASDSNFLADFLAIIAGGSGKEPEGLVLDGPVKALRLDRTTIADRREGLQHRQTVEFIEPVGRHVLAVGLVAPISHGR